ncbi:MAG: hypothetical protein K0S41_1843 [Anaerocolumna sp.]|jgi:hypothetical protein|nr:hypothetical protein [Anaerocolumna sp.]
MEMLMKHKILILVLSLALLLPLIYLVISYGIDYKTKVERSELKREFKSEILRVKNNADGKDRIILKNITKFKWDKVYFFRSYTPVEDINKSLGYNWSKAYSPVYDGVTLIVFQKDKTVVQYFESSSYFDDVFFIKGIDADEAILGVSEEKLVLKNNDK